MKITKRQLKRIIREEKRNLMEQFQGSLMDLDDFDSLSREIDRVIGKYVAMGYTDEDVLHAVKNILGI